MTAKIKGYAEFELDLREALLEKIVVMFDEMEPESLSTGSVKNLPDEQGVYQLFLVGKIVYVGKTDAKAGLRRRLLRHASKILHRNGLDFSAVTFKALRLYVFTPMDLEEAIISHYEKKEPVTWNGSGFGANDPGRERDTTNFKSSHFNIVYPIDLERNIDFAVDGDGSVADALVKLKSSVPYLIRWQKSGTKPHTDLADTVMPATRAITARQTIQLIVVSLPVGWQATELPGYVILCKETRDYACGGVLARSG